MPRAAVKLPSLPPPTLTPVERGRCRRRRAACRASGEQLGRRRLRHRRAVDARRDLEIVAARIDRRRAPPSPRRRARASSSVGDPHVDADRRLGRARRCRPCRRGATVGVTVVPTLGSASAVIASTWCAASTRALTPFSGSSPAWAARPWTTTSNVPAPLRPIFTAPPSAAGSSTSTASARRRPLLDQRPRRRRADLLVAVNSSSTPRRSASDGDGVDGERRCPPFMSNTPGPGGPPVGDARTAGRPACRAGTRCRDGRRGARAASPPPRQCTCGPAGPATSSGAEPSRRRPISSATHGADARDHGVDVVRRRLDVDEVAEVGDHHVDVERERVVTAATVARRRVRPVTTRSA